LGQYACWRLGRDRGEAETDDDGSVGDLFAGLGGKRGASSDELAKAAEMAAAWPLDRLLDPERPDTRLLLRRLASTAIEVFFMERFLRLAKPGGLIAAIVPEGILASGQLAPLRTWLLDELDLLAVVSLPQKVFAGVGANARTSVVFARRLLRPRVKNECAPAKSGDEGWDDDEDNGEGPRVLMTAPGADLPDLSLDGYFEDVLRAVREKPDLFRRTET
jgi:hypothetical protein